MKESFCLNEQFTFHSSWITAMSYISSKAVRNRLMASIIEYGLNSRHVPVGNATADAILSIAMDMIDRDGGRKTRREEYAEGVRASREEETVEKCDEKSLEETVEKCDEKTVEKSVEVSDKMSVDIPDEMPCEVAVDNADDGLDDVGEREDAETESETGENRPDSIPIGRLYLPVKHKSKPGAKRKDGRPHRRRHR